MIEPGGWLVWDEVKGKFTRPILYFPAEEGQPHRADRYREMDGQKARVGLEIQFGKYAFMAYDIFSKMIIFKQHGLIDYGIEIVLVQEMIDRMSTGTSAFEALMIDFEHRGEADIDIPVLVLGIGPTEAEWAEVDAAQALFRRDPAAAKARYPQIGLSDHTGTKPGPK